VKSLPEDLIDSLKDLTDEEKEIVLKLLLAEKAPTFNWVD
jgi:hypothetical protein